MMKLLNVKASSGEQAIEKSLSGGNQQKGCNCKMAGSIHPQLLILDEPTRGC